MANIGKDGKDNKDSSGSGGKKSKDEIGGLQKRVLQELAALRADVEAVKAASAAARQPVSTEELLVPVQAAVKNNSRSDGGAGGEAEDDGGKRFLQGLRDRVDASEGKNPAAFVAVGYAYRRKNENGDVEGASDLCVHGGLMGILSVDNGQAARLGQAFGSPQKIALVRVLIADGPQSGAQLEEKAGLTTGSLYHHLRELLHARVIDNENRNRYKMTELGRQTALLLMVQAGRLAEQPH